MKVIIHAGMHKTATSAVQTALKTHQALLEQAGFLISVHENRLLDKRTAPKTLNGFFEELKVKERQGYHTLITSSEVFSVFDQDRTKYLLNTLSKHTTKLILCFRHWTGFLPSRWRQNCHRRDTMPFGKFLGALLDDSDTRFEMRMDLVLQNLRAREFDEVGVVSYDNALKSKEGVVSCLLHAMEVPGHLISQIADQPGYINRSGQKIRADELRLLNGIWAEHLGLSQNAMYENMGRHRPVGRFFDLAPYWNRISKSDPDLKTALSKLIDDHKMTIRLKSDEFTEFANALEQESGLYLLNRIDGEMFHDIADSAVTCSDLEYSMVPKALKSDVIGAIQAVEENCEAKASGTQDR